MGNWKGGYYLVDYFSKKKIIVSYILSLLVVLIHISSFSNYVGVDYGNLPLGLKQLQIFLQCVITPFAVPLFFIISGVLFFKGYTNQNYVDKLKRRIKTLFIPYILWNILGTIFAVVATLLLKNYFIGRIPFDLSMKSILGGIFHYKYNCVFWFVFALIIFEIFAPILNLLLYNKAVGVISISVIIILCQHNIGLPVPLFCYRSCIAFFLLGGMYGKFYFDDFVASRRRSSLFIYALGLIGAIFYEELIFNEIISKVEMIDIIVRMVYAISFWRFSDLFVSRIPIKECMKHTFWIYALHLNIQSCISKMLWLIFPKNNAFILFNFILTVLITLITVELIYKFTDKFMPKVNRLLSGGR